MTSIPVCIPWRSDNGGRRDDLWRYARQEWHTHVKEATLFTANVTPTPVDGLFRRAWSCNGAVQLALDVYPNAEVLVIADADTVMVDWQAVYESIEVARTSPIPSLCYSHDIRWMLGPMDTEHLMSWGHTQRDKDPLTTGPHANTYSGVFAISRVLWDRVHGFDSRFEGWGFEDLAFMHACGTLGELRRVHGECMHLWHDRKPDEEDRQPHYLENWAVWQRYTAANGNPEAMLALVNEEDHELRREVLRLYS